MSSASPLLIGITGNIGTGKSTVASMLASLGAEVIDADKVAHEVMRAGYSAHAQIVETFGPQVLGPDGQVDRARLGSIVFANPGLLARLEAIVHPATLEAIVHRIAAFCHSERSEESSADVVVVEAIKLIESGMASGCDNVWVTTCRPRQQVYRIVGGRGLSRAEAWERVRAQPPQEDKIARADVVVDTSGSMSRTRAQVQAAWNRLISTAPLSSWKRPHYGV